MALLEKITKKETENRIKLITWDDFIEAVSKLSQDEKDLIMSDVINNTGDIRSIIYKQIQNKIKSSVKKEMDAYFLSGSIPIDVLNKAVD